MGGEGERMLDFDQILAYQILAKLKQMGGGWGGKGKGSTGANL